EEFRRYVRSRLQDGLDPRGIRGVLHDKNLVVGRGAFNRQDPTRQQGDARGRERSGFQRFHVQLGRLRQHVNPFASQEQGSGWPRKSYQCYRPRRFTEAANFLDFLRRASFRKHPTRAASSAATGEGKQGLRDIWELLESVNTGRGRDKLGIAAVTRVD